MPQTTIPLAGPFNTRQGITYASAAKDLIIKGAYVDFMSDGITQTSSAYLTKRFGIATVSTIVASKSSTAISVSADGRFCVAFSDGAVYFKNNVATAAVSVGTMVTKLPMYITPAYINNETYFLISDNGTNGCYYLPVTAATVVTPTFTANTNTNTTLSNVSSFTGLFVGQALSGTDIAAGARISSMDTGASTITMTAAATGTTVGVTVTFSRLAKIIDADFPSGVGGAFAFMDGYCFIMASDGKIYNSALNDPASWSANNYIQGSQAGSLAGNGYGVVRIKNRIVGMYSANHEYYYNAGNASGSPLSLIKETSSNIGVYNFGICGDYVLFMGAPSSEQLINCYLITAEGTKEISSPPISRDLSQGLTLTATNISGGRAGGYDLFFLSDVSGSASWMYCIQTNSWYETAFAADYIFSGAPIAAGLYAVSTSDSVLYSASSTTFQDAGSNFSVVYQSDLKSFNGGLPFIIDNINLLADTQSTGSTTLATSADDYANFGTVGSFDMTSPQKNLPCGGYYDTSVAFKLTHSANTAWRAQALVVTWRPA